tara:strand:+ start:237 stop:812 length:576 start_codon:yes stop_codon:yes gene_type:complete
MRVKWVKGQVKAGNLIYFEYNAKWREVLVFECPNDSGRRGIIRKKDGGTSKVLHGLELDAEGAATPGVSTVRDLILSRFGGTRPLLEKNGIQFYQTNFGYEQEDIMTPKVAYTKIKNYIQNIKGFYKTYSWSKIKDVRLTDNIDLKPFLIDKYKEEEKVEEEIVEENKKQPAEEKVKEKEIKKEEKKKNEN